MSERMKEKETKARIRMGSNGKEAQVEREKDWDVKEEKRRRTAGNGREEK